MEYCEELQSFLDDWQLAYLKMQIIQLAKFKQSSISIAEKIVLIILIQKLFSDNFFTSYRSIAIRSGYELADLQRLEIKLLQVIKWPREVNNHVVVGDKLINVFLYPCLSRKYINSIYE